MKRLLYIHLIFICLLSCKEDAATDAMQYPSTFNSISGPWRSVEIERSSLDNKSTWELIPQGKSDTLIFRSDGVVLNADNTPRCCAPATLIINGQLVDVRPQTALPNNPLCEQNCIPCPTWELSWTNNQLIISSCSSPRIKYVR